MTNAPTRASEAGRSGETTTRSLVPSVPLRSVPPVTGHARIRLSPGTFPGDRCDITGHADGLPAIVDLGDMSPLHLSEATVREVAWRTYTAPRVSVIGDDPAAVAYVARRLPAALAEAVNACAEVAT